MGQQSIVNTLKNAIKNNHLAHAFLFCGPRGVGKTTCARIFAKEINEFNSSEDIDDFSFNIFELDAASNNSVEDIRNLTEQVRIPPQRGKYKIFIIDEVHMLSKQAFNGFLKTLEELPVHAKFILATTEKHKIIPTIYHVVRYLISSAYKLVISLSTWLMWQKMKVLKSSKKPSTQLLKRPMAH